MKKFLLSALLGAASMLGAAEVIFDGIKAGVWETASEVKGEEAIIKLGYKTILSKDFIPVVKGKKYTISGEFFIPAGSTNGKNILYFGVVPFTADGKEIIHVNIAPAIPYSIASLAADVKVGDKSITIKGAENWKFLPHGRLAFNVKADRSDLPNFELSDFFDLSKTIKNSDGTVTVFCKKPLTKAYPAGTLVRQHRSGNIFIIAGFNSKIGEWMKFSATVKNFYPGTAKVKVALRLLNRGWDVQMKNVKIVAE